MVRPGDLSLVQGYLDALHWLFSRNMEFDWIANLTGQCYPVRPLKSVESFLAETKFDGFVQYYGAFSELGDNFWGAREGRARYLYHYRALTRNLERLQWALLRLPRVLRLAGGTLELRAYPAPAAK